MKQTSVCSAIESLPTLTKFEIRKSSIYTYHTLRSVWIPEHELIDRFNRRFIPVKKDEYDPVVKRIQDSSLPSFTQKPPTRPVAQPHHTQNKPIILKTKLCYNWISGCYRGDSCIFAHSVEALVSPFYEKSLLAMYESGMYVKLDEKRLLYLCKEIREMTCRDYNEKCTFYNNNSMSNKRMHLCIDESHSVMPYCVVGCKSCHYINAIPIYVVEKVKK